MWFQLSQPTILETSCVNDDGVQDQVQVGLGELVQDIAVATEVTHWLDQDVSLETEMFGGRISWVLQSRFGHLVPHIQPTKEQSF